MDANTEAKCEPQNDFNTLGLEKQEKSKFNVPLNKPNRIFNKYEVMFILIFSLSHLFGIIGLLNIFRGNVYPATVLLAIFLADLVGPMIKT
ncbi:unnamed protein product [Allacma fusca]|uniref:Uncharacterized protein n=1 Tax=Allacma fusca TaxID=39272 RepID=A0A8J2L2R7_9HEXA|nr:unnamed protein product [Allacma fusca]